MIFIGGAILLAKGAAWLVDGCASIARRLGIAPIVIGLTVVAFGTSAPELLVSVFSTLQGKTDVAIGNVAGSNIVNILLIIGVAAAIRPIEIKRETVWKQIPLALLSILIVLTLANDFFLTGRTVNSLDRIDGLILLIFFGVFLYYTANITRGEKWADTPEVMTLLKSIVYAVIGFLCLVIGGKLAVDGAVDIAHWVGLSERVIALTVVAIGTSLPELVTSAVASYKKHSDIAIGNAVGSNIFNVFWILGLSATIKPLPFSPLNSLDMIVAGAVTLALFIAAIIGKKFVIERRQGFVFIALYVIYLLFLFIN